MPRQPVVSWLLPIAAAWLIGCSAQSESPRADTEDPTVAVTSWTDRTELFMEHPPLVTGETVRFAVHLTRLSDFSALDSGRPAIELAPESGGSPVVLPGSDPQRPGVFRVEGTLPAAGRYRGVLSVDAPGLTDRHDLGLVVVHPDRAAAVAEAAGRSDAEAAAVAYLKEQQWTNPFATSVVRVGAVRRTIRVPASVDPVTGGEAIVGAPAAGRYTSEALPSVGDRVAQGDTLGRLEPRLATGTGDRASLEADLAETQAGVDAAKSELVRAERLLAEQAVPGRRVEDARRALGVAEARLRAAQARLAQRDEVLVSGGGAASGNAFVLRAPIGGRIAEVHAALGASYDEGAPLFRIIRTDRVELQVQISPADVPLSYEIGEIALEVPGRPEPIHLDVDHMHDAGVVDPRTRALPVQFDVDNRRGQLLIGQTGIAIIYTGERERMPVVPADAVLMEAGRPYVFVQTAGERFVRRPVEIAVRDGASVGIRSGVALGERVVTRGAYDVQLASASRGLPAEGHVH